MSAEYAVGRCDNFPACFSARERALKFLSASASAAAAAAAAAAALAGLYWYVIFFSALAGVRVGVSYSPAPAGAAAGEVEGVRAQFWASACNFGENNWFYPVFCQFLIKFFVF